MKYLFNHSVLFDTADYQLSLLKNDDSFIRLSNTAGRVLEELVLSHGPGRTLSREALFEHVWVKHGLQPSNGNLNQQISLIRKALVTLGLEPTAIITLPKRGLKLNDHLTVTPVEELSSLPAISASATGDDTADELPTTDFTGEIIAAKRMRFIRLAIVFIVMIAVAFFFYFYSNINHKQPLFFFEKFNTCDVYTFKPVREHDRAPMIGQLRQSMAGNIEKCNAHNILVFSHNVVINTAVRSGINQRVFLAKCDKDARGNISGCLNFYFYNWDQQ